LLGLSTGSFLYSPGQLGIQFLFCVGSLKKGKEGVDFIFMLRGIWGRMTVFSSKISEGRCSVFAMAVSSQASVGKGVHSAVSNNFRVKSGVKKHLSQLQSCDFI